MLSPEGRCKTLDASADGYVRAEACGALMLQAVLASAGHHHSLESPWPLQPAGTARSLIAVFAGSSVNQDGRSSSLTAPNGPAQQQVIRQALEAAGLEPNVVRVLQLHGTGGPSIWDGERSVD